MSAVDGSKVPSVGASANDAPDGHFHFLTYLESIFPALSPIIDTIQQALDHFFAALESAIGWPAAGTEHAVSMEPAVGTEHGVVEVPAPAVASNDAAAPLDSAGILHSGAGDSDFHFLPRTDGVDGAIVDPPERDVPTVLSSQENPGIVHLGEWAWPHHELSPGIFDYFFH